MLFCLDILSSYELIITYKESFYFPISTAGLFAHYVLTALLKFDI